MKTCFYQEKLMKQFGNPLFLSNFFMTPLFVQISKTRYSPPPLILRGGGNYEAMIISCPRPISWFKLEIQCPLAKIPGKNVSHHGWPTKKSLVS